MAEPGGPTCWEWYTWLWEPLRKTWGMTRTGLGQTAEPRIPLRWSQADCSGLVLFSRLGIPGHRGWGRPMGIHSAHVASSIQHHPAKVAEPAWGRPLGTRGGKAAVGRQTGHKKARVCLGETSEGQALPTLPPCHPHPPWQLAPTIGWRSCGCLGGTWAAILGDVLGARQPASGTQPARTQVEREGTWGCPEPLQGREAGDDRPSPYAAGPGCPPGRLPCAHLPGGLRWR